MFRELMVWIAENAGWVLIISGIGGFVVWFYWSMVSLGKHFDRIGEEYSPGRRQ